MGGHHCCMYRYPSAIAGFAIAFTCYRTHMKNYTIDAIAHLQDVIAQYMLIGLTSEHLDVTGTPWHCD